MTTTATDTPDLAQRARNAYSTEQLETNYRTMQRRIDTAGEICRALAKHDIAADPNQAFINAASGQICIPLVTGDVRMETDEEGFEYVVQAHAVAAEWDSDDRSVYLVADRDYDDPGFGSGRLLYPAGYLHTLADLGRAIEEGGRKPSTPITVKTEADRILHAMSGDYLDTHDTALLAAAEAVCAVLADIADAVRSGRNL